MRVSVFLFFFFSRYGAHRDLHSFPTRRSSDLGDVFEVPMEQYCAEALGAATKRLPRKASPTSRRHISYYSSPQLARFLDRKSTRLTPVTDVSRMPSSA